MTLETSHVPPVLTIDVVIPVRNESAYIDTLVSQVTAQTYPASRVFIVVASSQDDTLEKAHRHASEHPNIVVLKNPSTTAPHAMNIALERVTADAWVRIDGHTEVPTNFLRVLREELNTRSVACVGPILRPGARTRRQRAIGFAMSSPFGVGNARFRTGLGGSGPTDAVAFGLYRRAVTDIVGSYATEMDRNEDDLFNTRIRQAGGILWLTDTTSITYFPRSSFKALSSQYFQYGHWRIFGTLRHGNTIRLRQIAPGGLVLILGLSAAVIARSPRWLGGWLGPMAYSAVLVSQLVRETLRGADIRTALGSSIAMAVMHVSYAAGSLSGLLTCLRRPPVLFRPGIRAMPASVPSSADGTKIDDATKDERQACHRESDAS